MYDSDDDDNLPVRSSSNDFSDNEYKPPRSPRSPTTTSNYQDRPDSSILESIQALSLNKVKGCTISKTADIVRALVSDDAPKHIKHESQQNLLRLVRLYGSGAKKIKNIRGRTKPRERKDESDFAFTPTDTLSLHEKIQKSTEILTPNSIQSLEAGREAIGTIFELMYFIEKSLSLKLTRGECASLIGQADAKQGIATRCNVDLLKVFTFMKRLADHARTADRSRRMTEEQSVSNRQQEFNVSRSAYFKSLSNPIREPSLLQLDSALLKLYKSTTQMYFMEPLSFMKMCKTVPCTGNLDAAGIANYCLYNLHVKITLDEANAIVMVGDHIGEGNVPLSLWQHEILKLGMKKKSMFSPLDIAIEGIDEVGGGSGVHSLSNSSVRSGVRGSIGVAPIPERILPVKGILKPVLPLRGGRGDDDSKV